MQNENLKIGFIGAGNMSSALIRGIFSKETNVAPANIFVFDRHPEKINLLEKELNIKPSANVLELVENSNLIVLAIKPNGLADLISEIANHLSLEQLTKKIFISIAAGYSLENLTKLFINAQKTLNNDNLKIARFMPNMNVAIGQGASALTSQNLTAEEVALIKDIFANTGKIWQILEKDFVTFTALAGSSPAFIYMFIDSLAKAAVKHGIKKDQALEIAIQAVLGSAMTLEQTTKHPYELIDQVCSPGGTTIAGLVDLEKHNFSADIVSCIDKTIKKDKKLNKNK